MSAERLSWKSILSPRNSAVCLVISTEQEIDDFVRTAPKHRVAVWVVRGKRCRAKEQLLHEWAAALQFPGYFGNTWDALEDCLLDADWLHGDRRVVVVTNASSLLAKQKEDRSTLFNILANVTRHPKEAPFVLVFHTTAAEEEKTRMLLTSFHVPV